MVFGFLFLTYNTLLTYNTYNTLLGPFLLLQMALFLSFCDRVVFCCIYTHHIFFIRESKSTMISPSPSLSGPKGPRLPKP